MKIQSAKYRVVPGRKLELSNLPTKIEALYQSKGQYKDLLEKRTVEMAELQRVLYAHNRYALLIIFQAMDAAGKDSTIRHVMSGVNPQGCDVHSFKRPSSDELEHDFLWRTTCVLPMRGHIGIFNRSYYEEVLIVRVNPAILQLANLPSELLGERSIWSQRLRSINDLENHLHRNGTRVLKFFLHISKEEQRARFLARLKEPDKNWKFETDDLRERKSWDQYMTAYEECLRATSTQDSPWYVIPADDKKNARLLVSDAIVEALKALEMSYPRPDAARRQELKAIAKVLMDEQS